MNNWDDLRFLAALSKTGTMSGAARLLGTNTATVSRRIERLSETLGKPAFIKRGDGWSPSDCVAQLIHLAQDFDGRIQTAMNAQAAAERQDLVRLDIGCPPVVTSECLVPGLIAHRDALDGIALTFSSRLHSVGLGEHDLVIQLGPPETGRVITRKTGSLAFRLYQMKDGDTGGDWAGLDTAHDHLELMQSAFAHFGRPPKFRVDSLSALSHVMQVSGLPGPLCESLAARLPGCTPVLPEAAPFVAEFWLFYHESRRNDPGMRRAVEWVLQCFGDTENPCKR